MCDYLVLRKSPEAVFKHLVETLKYPLDETQIQNLAMYRENLVTYRPSGRTLFEDPFVILSTGVPKKYWVGPLRWGIQIRENSPIETMIPNHSLSNMNWGRAFKERRCLVLVTGFVYRKMVSENSRLFYTHFKDDRIFTLPAIYQTSYGYDSHAFALTNVSPSLHLARLGYNNMPAILNTKNGYKWLRPNVQQYDLGCLLQTYEDSAIETTEVHTLAHVGESWID